jgi:hypothetical protein
MLRDPGSALLLGLSPANCERPGPGQPL